MKYLCFVVCVLAFQFFPGKAIAGANGNISVSSTVAMPIGLDTPPDTFDGDIGTAGEEIRDAMRKYKVRDRYLFYSMEGMQSLYNGNPGDAIKLFSASIKSQPEFTEAYENRSLAYEQTGNYKAALEDYESLIKLDSSNAPYYRGKMGGVYMVLGENEKAIEGFNAALKRNPKDAISMRHKSLALSNIGKYAEAGEAYQKAVELNHSVKLPADTHFCDVLKQHNVEPEVCRGK